MLSNWELSNYFHNHSEIIIIAINLISVVVILKKNVLAIQYWDCYSRLLLADTTNYIHLIKFIGGVTFDVNNERTLANNDDTVPLTAHLPNSPSLVMFVEAMHLRARRAYSMFSFYWQCNWQTILKFAPYQYITGLWQVYDVPFSFSCEVEWSLGTVENCEKMRNLLLSPSIRARSEPRILIVFNPSFQKINGKHLQYYFSFRAKAIRKSRISDFIYVVLMWIYMWINIRLCTLVLYVWQILDEHVNNNLYRLTNHGYTK